MIDCARVSRHERLLSRLGFVVFVTVVVARFSFVSAQDVARDDAGVSDAGVSDGGVSLGSIRVRARPAGARVAIDGTPAVLRDGLVQATPGEHTIRVSALDYHSDERRVLVEAGRVTRVQITLRRVTQRDLETAAADSIGTMTADSSSLGIGVGSGLGSGSGISAARPPSMGRVRVGAPIVTGPRNQTQVRRVVAQSAASFDHCYEARLQRRSELAGDVMISFDVALDGTVSNARRESASFADAEVEGCFLRAIGRLRFPPAEHASHVSLPLSLIRTEPR